MNYEIKIYLQDGTIFIKNVQYEKVYDLRRDVTNIGVNGYLREISENKFEYFPQHKIDKIEVN